MDAEQLAYLREVLSHYDSRLPRCGKNIAPSMNTMLDSIMDPPDRECVLVAGHAGDCSDSRVLPGSQRMPLLIELLDFYENSNSEGGPALEANRLSNELTRTRELLAAAEGLPEGAPSPNWSWDGRCWERETFGRGEGVIRVEPGLTATVGAGTPREKTVRIKPRAVMAVFYAEAGEFKAEVIEADTVREVMEAVDKRLQPSEKGVMP